MQITKEDWNEASAVLDVAHDVLLNTGVQCGSTYGKAGSENEHNPKAEENCLWDAIAIAMGRYTLGLPAWREMSTLCLYPDDIGMSNGKLTTGVEAAIGRAIGKRSPHWNDKATEDEVFEALREGSKMAREQADAAEY